MVFVSATKGLENGTLLRISEVIREVLRPAFDPRVAVISGPTFAREVARFEPTALVVAGRDETLPCRHPGGLFRAHFPALHQHRSYRCRNWRFH